MLSNTQIDSRKWKERDSVDLNYFWAPVEDKGMYTNHNLCKFAAIAVQGMG